MTGEDWAVITALVAVGMEEYPWLWDGDFTRNGWDQKTVNRAASHFLEFMKAA